MRARRPVGLRGLPFWPPANGESGRYFSMVGENGFRYPGTDGVVDFDADEKCRRTFFQTLGGKGILTHPSSSG